MEAAAGPGVVDHRLVVGRVRSGLVRAPPHGRRRQQQEEEVMYLDLVAMAVKALVIALVLLVVVEGVVAHR